MRGPSGIGKFNCIACGNWLRCCTSISAPMASAVRSTALVVTDKPASNFTCWRPCAKGSSWPTAASHAAHSGGEFRILYVQFEVDGKLTVMAVVTQIVRAQAFGGSDRGDHGFG